MNKFRPFPEEDYPSNIFYIALNDRNLEALKNIKSLKGFEIYPNGGYIKVDTEKLSWCFCLSFEFLYRNEPLLSTIEDVRAILRKNNVEDFLKEGEHEYE